jgi:hypothetical protein
MRRLLAAGWLAPLAAGLLAGAGCGGSHASSIASVSHATRTTAAGQTTSSSAETSPAPLDATVDADRDNDIHAAADDTNNNRVLSFGHDAVPSERRAITALVKRYYAAALAEDGARGCALLYSTLAEAAPEDDSREPGTPAYMHGQTTCAGVLHALFHHYHAQLAAELPKLQITSVRLEEHKGFAFLRFGKLPERKISVQRERHTWKMSQIFDEELP